MAGLDAIVDCALGRWSPRIGDPTAMGWVTVAAYALAAALALGLALGRARGASVERAFWALAALYLACLAVNKQLDLQTLGTEIGRCAARAGGWYGERRAVQVAVIGALVAAAALAGALALALLRRTLPRTGLALLGLFGVTVFVLVRAVGFHEVDRLIGLPRADGLRLNWIFELGAIALFVGGALRALAGSRRGRRG